MALAGDHVQVLVGGYELTADSHHLVVDEKRDAYDVTAFSDGAHRFLGGMRRAGLEHSGYLNAAAAGSHPVLSGAAVRGIVSVLLGQNATPATGDPMFSLDAQQGKYQTLPEAGKYVPFTAQFAVGGEWAGWGVALAVPTSFTNTITGATVDNGAASSKGGLACLHVLQAAASDTYTIVVEGSATGAFAGEQTTLATFTLNASTLGSEAKALPISVPRYARFKATRSGSAGNSVRIALSLVRF